MAGDVITGVAGLPTGMMWATVRRGRPQEAEEGVLEPGVPGTDVPGSWSGPVVLAIPSSQMVMRVMEFPVEDASELASMVELQVDKFSPFPLEQMVVSHEMLARHDGMAQVLMAAAKTSVIGAIGQGLRDRGVKISRVDSTLLGRWQTLQEAGQLESSGRETLVLLDGGGVDILTHEAGVPVALSGLGEVADLGDPDIAGDVAREIAHLLMGLDAEHGRAGHAVLTVWSADDAAAAALVAALRGCTTLAVRVRSLSLLSGLAGGIARRALAGGQLLDLTPPAWRAQEQSSRFQKRIIMLTAALGAGWLLLLGGGRGLMALQRTQVERLRASEIRWLEPANAVRRLRLQVHLIHRYMDRRTSALECLREISELQPPGVDLTSFTYRKGEGLELVGEADSGPLVIQFNQRLNDSPLFVAVRAGPRTMTPRQRHRFSFEISFSGEDAP